MRGTWMLGLWLWSSLSTAADIKFQKAGQEIKTLSDAQLNTLAPAVSIEVYEPHELQNVRYKAYPAKKILDAVFGADWKKREEILFTCVDGYQPSIPVEAFLKNESYFAFQREENPSFNLTNKLHANEKVELGPLYLIWDNINSPALKAEGASRWPYQVVGIDLVSFQSRFSAMAPAAKASPAVTRGFLDFRTSCTSCHRINGIGGDKSIELNYPMSVTEYYKPGFLSKWIDKPQSVRWNSAMPPFNQEHPERTRAIADIVSYLEHMAKHKKAPPGDP